MSVHPSNCSVHWSTRSVRPSVCLFISFVPPSVHSVDSFSSSNHAVCPYIYLSVYLSIRSVPIHLSVCPSGNITVCPICLLAPPSVHLSIHPYYTSIQSVWQSIFSVCPSVHLDSAHQSIWSICHFKGHFDPTDRNERTSESIINKYSSQTDYPSVCSPSIHSVHPYIRPAGNSICLSICLFSPFVHHMDGETSFFFSERKLCFRSCDLMY